VDTGNGTIEIKLTLSTIRQASAFLAFMEAKGEPAPSPEVYAAERVLQRGGLRVYEPLQQSEGGAAVHQMLGGAMLTSRQRLEVRTVGA
jgi:hypothetical protein